MGLPVEVNNLMLGSLGGYTVGRSLRFRSSASAYLQRTNATTGTDPLKFTVSGWMKRGLSSASYFPLVGSDTGSNAFNFIGFSGDNFAFRIRNSSSVDLVQLVSTAVFRDFSAWYHFVAVYDSANATSTERVKLYVNGVQITAFATATYPSLNQAPTGDFLTDMQIGRTNTNNVNQNYGDGYLAEVNFIDGQALTPSSFGAYDTNGVWQPKKYSGTYGTNGFYLPFSNTTSTTTLVQDSSGNGNNWTPNNISLTAGTTYDSMIDSPTVSASSSNYAVLNPLRTASSTTVSNGNLSFSDSTNNHNYLSTIGMTSGKWYFEFVASASGFSAAHAGIAISTISPDTYIGSDTNGYAYHATTGQVLYNNSALGTYSTWTSGDVIGVAYDADGGKLYVAKNNTWQNSGNPAAGTGAVATGIASGTWFFGIGGNPSALLNANFGQQPFVYTPPSGFKALNTYNLPAPSIANGAQHFGANLYTGTGATQSIVNSGSFRPDLIWGKQRNGASSHVLTDSVRGTNSQLSSNLTNAQDTQTDVVTAFNSNGFTVGASAGFNMNQSGSTLVAWQWKAGGTGVSNTSGTITSTVSANTTAGFSVVTYAGTGANATVGHGLGVAPSMIIIKNRTLGTENWAVYHTSTGAAYWLLLSGTNAAINNTTIWQNTSPTSSVFSLGPISNSNVSGSNFVAYCFAAVRGYSAFGSYTGNGSADGPFIYTGFRPRFVMIKNITTGGANYDWVIADSSREPNNTTQNNLAANTNASEASGILSQPDDFLSNGFKIRASGANAYPTNASGSTYIYAAFAENPFNYSRAR